MSAVAPLKYDTSALKVAHRANGPVLLSRATYIIHTVQSEHRELLG